MTEFIGLRAVKSDMANGEATMWGKASVKHFNPAFIMLVDEKLMLITLYDGTKFRIDEESLQIFLSAMYGENGSIRGDKLNEED